MAEVWFYHIVKNTADDALPGLLLRGVERGLRMAVVTSDENRAQTISARLWGHDATGFLAHGFAGEPFPDRQSIYISADGSWPNAAQYAFFLDGTSPSSLEALDRASLMFDGNDQTALEAARALWRKFKTEGAVIRYWKQDEDGRWMDQAAQRDAAAS